MAGRDFSSELFGSEAGYGRNLSAELFGSPPEDKGFFSNIGNLLVEGGQRAIGAAQIAPSVVSGNVGEDQAKLLSEEISRKPSVQPKELLEVQSAFKDEAAAFDKAEGFRESIGPFGDFLLEFGKQAITNPKGAVYLTAQSAANMAPQIAGMLAGGKGGAALGALSANPFGIAIGAGVGAITGGFAASAPLEIGSEFIGRIGEELSNRGMEPTTENITALLKDTKTVEKAVSDARTKGVTTAAVDSLMTVGAGKFASGARKSAIDAARKELGVAAQAAQIAKRADDIFKARTLTQKVGRGAGAVGIDVAGGGISEAAGQGVAYGKVDLQDVGMEMLGELGGAAIEVPAAAKSLAMRPKTAAPEIVAPPDTITPPETVTPPATTEVAELPVTEKQPVAILPPSSVFTEQDILGTEVSIPGGNLPAVRRNVLGKTRDELEAFVNENPEVLENESPTSRVIQSLLQQTGGQRDQPSVELPVPPTEPTVQPDTQGIVTPEPTGMGAPSTFAGETTPTTPIAIPPVTIQPTPEQPNGLTSPETIETETQRPEETGEIILQNRDRSSQASIEQMQVISAKPDYGRMSFSRDFANGAPAVFGGTIDPSQLGAKDVAIAPDGRRIPVRYAVMEVDDVLASNDANGLTNVDYANATDRTRVIAGNGRIAGLQLGYQRKTTDNYVKELKSDLRLHGVDLAAIDRIKQPVLVRIMPNQFVTQNIGDVSNTPAGLRLSAIENAKNDLRRVDLNALQFNDDGSISENTIRGFIQAMPQTERGEFIGTKGKPTTQAYDRLNGAIFAKAYNNDQLIELYTQTQDPEARNILSALARVAPKMARLDGAGNLDIRNIVTEAAEIAVNARRQGLPLSRAAQQIDVVADPDVYAVLEMFSNNSRSPKATAEALSNLADNAFEAYNAPSEDFFGEVPRISREELMKNFRIKNEKTDDKPMEDATGRGAPKEDDVQPTPEPARQEPPATNETKAEVTPPPGESVEVQRAAVQRFEMALQQTIPPTRVNATGRRTVLKPKPLSAPQVKLLSDLATRALRLGIPSSLLDRITAGGSTGLNAVAAMFPTRGWLALGSQWSSRSNDEKFFYLIHELAHLAEQDGDDAYVFSKDPSWAKAHKELEAWYKNEPLKNILAYPFNAQFEKSVPNKKAESFAQSFAIYITNPVVLQEKAPAAYSIIANALERLKNESQATTSASPAKREITKNNVLQKRVGSDEDVQSQTGRVVLSVGTTQRGDTGADARQKINLAEAPGVTTEVETVEQKARRENIFGDGVITTWTMPTDTKIMGLLKDDVIYSLQNKQIDLKRVVDSIKSTSKNIGAKWDAYLQETLYHGRTATRTKAYLEDELKKQVEAIQKFGLTKEDVGEYLHNRHAPEANAHIAERNERYPDGGSGIKTADALKYMEDLSPQKRKQFEQVAALIDDGTRKMQDELVEYGLESPETIATWRDMFSFYIPLNRVDADFDTSKAMSQGAGYSTSGASAKSRTGSTKDVNVNEILANLAMQRERAIVRAEKNRVAQALYGLALQNPNPDFWLALDPSTNPVWQSLRMERQLQDDITLMETIIEEGDVDPSNIKDYEREITLYKKLLKKEKSKALGSLDKVRQQLTDLGLDPALVENIMMPPMKARYDKARNKVVYEPNSSFANPFVFSARVNGEDKFLLFNANDARAKRMVESLKNMDADQLGIAMSTMAKITRYFSAINTQYNPVFGAYNFLRDVQAGLIQINDTEIADQKKKVVAGTLPALRAIYQSTRKLRKGEKPETEWSKLYEEFQKEGGQTGFRDVFSQSNERATAIQRMIDPASWSESPLGNVFSANGTLKVPLEQARKTAKPLFDWLSDYNESMENSIRLSAYKAAKDKFIGEGTDAGSAKQRAAAIAKELTVNFNRKGQVATQAGALYAFFNASVQGTTRMFQLLKSPVGKKIAAGAFLLGSMQALLLAGAGFDEEEPPEFIKQRNYIIPIGDGKYLAFPMPLGFNVLPNTTRIITEWALSGFKDTPRRVLDITDAMLDMFNPVGNAGWSFQTFAPTVFDPMVALFENKDWTGQDISRKDFSDLDPTPGYSRSKDSSSWLGEQVAYFLNFASGGTEDKKGALSPTADDLEYLIGQATGGIGREFLKVAKTAKSLSTGEELPPYNVPLFGRFYGDIKGMAPTANAFYRNLTELNGHTRAVEGLKERRGDVQGYIRENPEARLSASANIQYREIQKLRKQRRNAIEKDNKELAKKIEEAIKVRMMRVNESFDEVSK